ncbi:hypothetical protein SAMN05216368_11260 [Cryobacterium flavum]|uniref:Asp23/Gls24 family envelope stress response protein n=1 Tax=Cryobacterium flavum TaxID=1424659 RepID=A0A4R8UU66_9MICO|nr:hypothetical protein E3O21_19390 [Cryobacterium flavum]SDO20426.1 hypothetical protein SAMN05216368_11260 [Cryobacterium flavum]
MSVTTDSPGWFLGEGIPSDTPMEPANAALPAATSRGRTRIVPRALRQIVSMVTAESLGVTPNQVGVELGDDHGMLALTVSTSIRVVSLQRVTSEAALITRTGGTILARSAQSQTDIRRRVGELTGADIGRVTVRVNGTDVARERRVR